MKHLTHRLSKICASLLSLTTLNGMLLSTVSANSAQTHWLGTDATGLTVSESDCPIVVEHETLTFNIDEFPVGYYRDAASFLAHSASVEAEYKFHNPADYTVKATLVFPFGKMPEYAFSQSLYADAELMSVHTRKYTVTLDGEEIDGLTLRHTYSPDGARFELATDVGRLHDGFMEHEFYSPDLTVTRYTYLPSGIVDEQGKAEIAVFIPDVDPSETRVLLERQNGITTFDDKIRMQTTVSEGNPIILYAIGEPFDESLGKLPDWKIYGYIYGDKSGETEIAGEMLLIETETLTLKEYALSKYDEKSGIHDYDWYNAIIEQFLLHDKRQLDRSLELDVTRKLMRWYQYEIELAPGEYRYNKVVAPLYPSIDSGYAPPTYEYTYLLSPAKSWADFGTLCIMVKTDAFMLDAEKYGFAKSGSMYEVLYDGLPDGELVFTLSESENPKQLHGGISPILFIPVGAVAVLIGAVAVTNLKRKTER